MEEAKDTRAAVDEELEKLAAGRARERARIARWDLDVAVFLFVILIIVIILLFQEIGIEVVAPVAIVGLALVWVCGWRRGKQLYDGFYEEELSRLEMETDKKTEESLEETIEERVQKALRERWR